MQSLGYLTEAEYKQAMAQPIVMKSAEGTPAGGYAIHGEYVAELARQLLFNVYQDNVYSRGLNIYTTVQSKDQEAAYRAVREGVLEYTRRAPYPGRKSSSTCPPAPRATRRRWMTSWMACSTSSATAATC